MMTREGYVWRGGCGDRDYCCLWIVVVDVGYDVDEMMMKGRPPRYCSDSEMARPVKIFILMNIDIIK